MAKLNEKYGTIATVYKQGFYGDLLLKLVRYALVADVGHCRVIHFQIYTFLSVDWDDLILLLYFVTYNNIIGTYESVRNELIRYRY